MCHQNVVVYTCLHTKCHYELCLESNPRTCTTRPGRDTDHLYAPHACLACRHHAAEQWRLAHQVETLLREEAKKREREDERMAWDERYRVRILAERREAHERMMVLEMIERVRRAELEEVVRRIREDDEARRLAEMARAKEVVCKKEVRLRKRDLRKMGDVTKKVWNAFGSGVDDGTPAELDLAEEQEATNGAAGLGISFR